MRRSFRASDTARIQIARCLFHVCDIEWEASARQVGMAGMAFCQSCACGPFGSQLLEVSLPEWSFLSLDCLCLHSFLLA